MWSRNLQKIVTLTSSWCALFHGIYENEVWMPMLMYPAHIVVWLSRYFHCQTCGGGKVYTVPNQKMTGKSHFKIFLVHDRTMQMFDWLSSYINPVIDVTIGSGSLHSFKLISHITQLIVCKLQAEFHTLSSGKPCISQNVSLLTTATLYVYW